MTYKKCDRCHRTTEELPGLLVGQTSFNLECYEAWGKRVDLCTDCWNNLKVWLYENGVIYR